MFCFVFLFNSSFLFSLFSSCKRVCMFMCVFSSSFISAFITTAARTTNSPNSEWAYMDVNAVVRMWSFFGKKNDDECFASHIGDHNVQKCERTTHRQTDERTNEEKSKPNASSFSKLITHRAILIFHLKSWQYSSSHIFKSKVCTTCQNVVGKIYKFFSRVHREFVWNFWIDGIPTGWIIFWRSYKRTTIFLKILLTDAHTQRMGVWSMDAIKTVRHKFTSKLSIAFSTRFGLQFNFSQ